MTSLIAILEVERRPPGMAGSRQLDRIHPDARLRQSAGLLLL